MKGHFFILCYVRSVLAPWSWCHSENKRMLYVNVKCKYNFNVKDRKCLRNHPSERLMIKCLTIQIELEFGNIGFWGEGKTRVPGEKPLEARKRTNNKLN